MNRTAGLLLVALAIAASAWMAWAPTGEAPPVEQAAGSCSGSGETVCGDVAGQAASEPETATRRSRTSAGAPDPSDPQESAASAVPAAAEGDRLREQADRLFAEGRAREAVEAMRKAAEVDPTARNHGDLGAVLERLTAFDEAVRHLRRAAELDPSNADRWLALANAYYRAVQPGEAWKAERRAKEAEPGLVLRRDESGRLVRQGGAHDTDGPNP